MAESANLEVQVSKLQDDIKSIMQTLTKLGEDKISDVRSTATRRARNIADRGQAAIHDVEDEFGMVEKQIKDTIREKPLTAVAGAVALGFLLALVTR